MDNREVDEALKCADTYCNGDCGGPAILAAAVRELREQKEKIEAVKNGAYSERNKLVAAMSKLFPASLERHEGVEWEDDWRWVVFMDLPTGQASWHLHDSELPQFDHLPRKVGRKWDGHTNDEKYARLAALPPVGVAALPTEKCGCGEPREHYHDRNDSRVFAINPFDPTEKAHMDDCGQDGGCNPECEVLPRPSRSTKKEG